ncbi:helix-turn-helix domain-containing protein [Streptomyces sp. MMS24-I2-30]|uniref:helix-turn-helix domain-containing protein n=1 Tax=Streptomyces sp. MMS24-I2-30 TaxID=3351564 RepID=UPI003896DAC9
MDTENPSAPPHSESRIPGKNHPDRHRNGRPGGVIHDNARHSTHFTVIGNHLTQHRELSLLAIGLACHIQSLPTGAPVDIKTLAARFPEGPTRIAAALNELQDHGYLRRTRQRVDGGRIVTRTVSCNRPGHHSTTTGTSTGTAVRAATETSGRPPRRPAAEKPAPRTLLPAVPKPAHPSPDLLHTALALLAGLHRADPRLLLSATDVEHLAPGVTAWLERDLPPTAVRHALTANLPQDPLHRPAAFLAHRLTAQLPPPPPFRAPAPPPEVPHPLQNCDSCDLAFRAPAPGHCRSCRSDPPDAA